MADEQGKTQETGSFRVFFRDTSRLLLIGISFIFLILSFGVIWYSIGSREAVIVLHYNVYFGIDVLGEWWQAYFIPLSGIGIWAVHILLAFRFFQVGKKFLSQIALSSLLLLEGMVLVASVAIGLVNY